MRLPRHPLSAISILLPLMLSLTACSSEKDAPETRTAVTASASTHELRQQMFSLQTQIIDIDRQIAQMRIQHMQSLDELNEAATELCALAEQVQRDLGATGDPIPIEESGSAGRLIEISNDDQPSSSARQDSPGFFFRVFLVAVILLSVWFLARIFLGRMDDEDEFGDEVYMGPNAQRQTAEGTISMSPEVARAAAERADGGGFEEDFGDTAELPENPSEAGDSPEKSDKP